ncbi:MAG: DEAD/DEAH box helicase family protein [Clostridia bacterium]|nr:DEAD/DEAH box helicase family protein [Clostridia bacterium]
MENNKFFVISAGDLADHCFPQGSLSVLPSVERMFQGTSAHKKLQNVYSENESITYKREVPLETVFQYENFSLKIQGRADGIIFDKEKYSIHEIKSTYTSASAIEKPLKASHKAQMMIYAYILAEAHSLSRINGRLSYFCLSDDTIIDLDYSFEFESLKAVVKQMADSYASLLTMRLSYRQALVTTASALAFPFESFRQGQREGAKQIFTALKQNKNLFLQAPTGTGKTVMALFPAIKYLEQDDAKIFCLSAKNQTMSSYESTLALMRKKGLKIKSCTICAKSKYCFYDVQDCSGENCPYSLDFYPKLHAALPEMLLQDNFDFDTIRSFAEKYQLCPYELALELSLESNVIICDYNYLFDPIVYLRRYFDEDGKYIFLIDEAHNLVERGRDMLSADICRADLQKIKKQFSKEHVLYKQFGKILTQLNKILKSEEPLSRDSLKALDESIFRANQEIFEYSQKAAVPNESLLLLKELVRFSTLLGLYNEEDFILYHSTATLFLQCIDPSKNLESGIKKGQSAILFSATLQPYEFYKNCILPDSESFGFSVDYPFNKDNLTVLADYSVDTRFTLRENFFEIIARKIELYRQSVKGNFIVFFPSFKFMESVAEFCSVPLLIQTSDSNKEARENYLKELREGSLVTAFAVMGSHFSEGIDLNGLAGIVIVGVALPKFDLSRTKIQEHFEKKYKKGFEYAYVYPGINKVSQAAGRLIRSEDDKGFLILMDSRFQRYKSLLPPHWNVLPLFSDSKAQEILSSLE